MSHQHPKGIHGKLPLGLRLELETPLTAFVNLKRASSLQERKEIPNSTSSGLL
jgi:hypothetical protein